MSRPHELTRNLVQAGALLKELRADMRLPEDARREAIDCFVIIRPWGTSRTWPTPLLASWARFWTGKSTPTGAPGTSMALIAGKDRALAYATILEGISRLPFPLQSEDYAAWRCS